MCGYASIIINHECGHAHIRTHTHTRTRERDQAKAAAAVTNQRIRTPTEQFSRKSLLLHHCLPVANSSTTWRAGGGYRHIARLEHLYNLLTKCCNLPYKWC